MTEMTESFAEDLKHRLAQFHLFQQHIDEILLIICKLLDNLSNDKEDTHN